MNDIKTAISGDAGVKSMEETSNSCAHALRYRPARSVLPFWQELGGSTEQFKELREEKERSCDEATLVSSDFRPKAVWGMQHSQALSVFQIF